MLRVALTSFDLAQDDRVENGTDVENGNYIENDMQRIAIAIDGEAIGSLAWFGASADSVDWPPLDCTSN